MKESATDNGTIFSPSLPPSLSKKYRGTRQEMTKQVVYAAERAGALMPCDGPARVKFLVNTRGGGFRVPDADYRAVVFEVLHRFYPWLENCHVGFFLLFSLFHHSLTFRLSTRNIPTYHTPLLFSLPSFRPSFLLPSLPPPLGHIPGSYLCGQNRVMGNGEGVWTQVEGAV